MHDDWIAERMHTFDASGIRRVFDLASKLKDPINLSIGQPDFPVPPEIRQACTAAIEAGKNGYTPTQGIGPLAEKLKAKVAAEYPNQERGVLVTSGTSGGLVLAMLSLVNPGDEVILFDPYFKIYEPLVKIAGGTLVLVDTYPDFQVDVAKVEAAITPRTKLILLNSPCNPTGVVASAEVTRQLALLAARRGVMLISDEIYRDFCFDEQFHSPAAHNPDTLVIDGFSKSHALTGWRVGFAHGPKPLIEQMTKLQQFTFVCAPQPAQWACLAALDVDMSAHLAAYQAKRDKIYAGLRDHFELAKPGGAFYAFPKAPWGTGTQFVEAAILHGLLIIPGGIFSQRDTHVRISYAASDATLDRGIDVLNQMAKNGK